MVSLSYLFPIYLLTKDINNSYSPILFISCFSLFSSLVSWPMPKAERKLLPRVVLHVNFSGNFPIARDYFFMLFLVLLLNPLSNMSKILIIHWNDVIIWYFSQDLLRANLLDVNIVSSVNFTIPGSFSFKSNINSAISSESYWILV